MSRACAVWILSALLGASVVAAQQSRPRFEVTSVKKTDPPVIGEGRRNLRAAGIFDVQKETVFGLLIYAYDLVEQQLLGLPEWGRTDWFEIAARGNPSATDAELRQMVQSLLEERFRLVIRREQRRMSRFEVKLARADGKLGPNMQPVPSCRPEDRPKRGRPPRNAYASYGCGDMSAIARTASRPMQAFVADSTGVLGTFDYAIYTSVTEIARFGFRPIPAEELAASDDGLPTFETAIQEQLGLKLERAEGLVPVVVIESIEQPTEN